MDPWQTILLAFGGNAALLAVLGLLGKSLLEKVIARDTKRYESELKASTDAAIERLRNDLVRSVESYKVQLKKSEFLFQQEFAAALEFTALVRSVIPRPSRPDMDWEDAMQQVIDRFDRTERELVAFLSARGPVLADDERQLLNDAISDANNGRLYGSQEGDPSGFKIAESLCEKLEDLEKRLIKRVRSQSRL